eukprot:3540024-Pyramimonas_sp.AAC.1
MPTTSSERHHRKPNSHNGRIRTEEGRKQRHMQTEGEAEDEEGKERDGEQQDRRENGGTCEWGGRGGGRRIAGGELNAGAERNRGEGAVKRNGGWERHDDEVTTEYVSPASFGLCGRTVEIGYPAQSSILVQADLGQLRACPNSTHAYTLACGPLSCRSVGWRSTRALGPCRPRLHSSSASAHQWRPRSSSAQISRGRRRQTPKPRRLPGAARTTCRQGSPNGMTQTDQFGIAR